MGRRLILDTNVLIEYERRTLDRTAFDADEPAIAAHAAETGRLLTTRDAKARFGELPGVIALEV